MRNSVVFSIFTRDAYPLAHSFLMQTIFYVLYIKHCFPLPQFLQTPPQSTMDFCWQNEWDVSSIMPSVWKYLEPTGSPGLLSWQHVLDCSSFEKFSLQCLVIKSSPLLLILFLFPFSWLSHDGVATMVAFSLHAWGFCTCSHSSWDALLLRAHPPLP